MSTGEPSIPSNPIPIQAFSTAVLHASAEWLISSAWSFCVTSVTAVVLNCIINSTVRATRTMQQPNKHMQQSSVFCKYTTLLYGWMSSLAHEQVNFCHLPVQLPSVNTQYNPPPISSGRNVASVKIFEQKKVCLLRTVMAECPQNRAPAARPTPLYADTTPAPLLWIIIMRSPRPKSRTFWSCIGEQEEERGVSGLHLAFGSMDNLPFAHWQCWHCHEKQIRHGKGCFEF